MQTLISIAYVIVCFLLIVGIGSLVGKLLKKSSSEDKRIAKESGLDRWR